LLKQRAISTYDPEEAHEALRRIREAEKTGSVELDLSLSALKRLPQELEQLTSLQNLSFYERLSGDLARWPADPHNC
jgi:hypothetical protein